MKKGILFSVLAIVSVFWLASMASATEGYRINKIEINDVVVYDGPHTATVMEDVGLVAGENAKIEIWFEASDFKSDNNRDQNVEVEVELDVNGEEATATGMIDTIRSGQEKKVTVNIEVPYEFDDDETSTTDVELTINIDGEEYELDDFNVPNLLITVDKPNYNIDIKSVSMDSTVEAGETFAVDIVLENAGFNDLEDLYVTVRIPALNVEKTEFFGDIVAIECSDNDLDCDDEDAEDTVYGRLLLKVPYDAESGIYTLEIEVKNDDLTLNALKQFSVSNDLPNEIIVDSYTKSVSAGEDAEYELLIVNPTDKLKVYRIVTENSGDLTTSARETVVAVPAGSSKSVTVMASADSEGNYSFDVSIFAGEELVDTVTLNLNVEGKSTADLTVVLTVILAIIFIVLLIVLIVLIGKKPAKTEEFGESYY